MPIHRGGWPFAGPPNTEFTLNTESPQRTGLVGWWPTLGSRGNGLTDYVSGRMNASPGTMPTWTGSELGSVLDYESSSSQFLVISNPGFLPNGSNAEWSISAWVNPETATGFICSWGDGSTSAATPHLSAGDGTYWRVSTWGSGNDLDGSTAIVLGEWVHLVGTCNGSALWLYVNGNQDGYDSSVTSTPLTDAARIGEDPGDNFFRFDGMIGDVRIYDYALPASIIRQMYDADTRWDLYQPVIPWALPIPLAAPPTPPDDKLPDKIRIARTYQIPIHQLQL